MDVKRTKGRASEDPCSPTEHAEFRSGVGNLHWVTPQTRPDQAFDTSRLQKRQNKPRFEDLKELKKVIDEVKATADAILRIRPLEEPILGAFTDSGLYGAEGEPLSDSDLDDYDKHKINSQQGTLLVMLEKDALEQLGDIPISISD